MKKVLGLIGVVLLGLVIFLGSELSIEEKRTLHKEYLKNSPFKKTLQLSKKERKANGLPPNKYFEREWELSMNPESGRVEPEKVLELQSKLNTKQLLQKSPGDAVDNSWIERGPNNVGGRTRVLLFDPNDFENKRVFAGAVSGGLWVNDDITNLNSSWTQVTGVPSNMNVSCLTVDPRDSKIWYLGTGEQYTFGAAVGNGVFKTIDGGSTWEQLNVVAEGTGDISFSGFELLSGVYYINDIIAWDNGTSTEIFVAVGSHVYGDASDPVNFLGTQSAGLYRSLDAGLNWSRIENAAMEFSFGAFMFYYTPNDLEISADNTLWMGGIASSGFGSEGGGRVFKSLDGETWSLVRILENSNRVELAVSSSNDKKMYALTEGTNSSGPHIYGTLDAFETVSELSKPNDADSGISADDFTRGQSFYDLMIEVDPNNDDLLYVGGIDLFRSIDGAFNWEQISRWNNTIDGSSPVVHADQHAMAFRPGNSNQAVFGNDGGVYYASSLSSANTISTAIESVISDYNVTQFYYTAMSPSSEGEYFLGGTQDNGTPYFSDANSQNSIDISGGDGAACFVDQVGESYVIVSYVYNNYTRIFNLALNAWRTINSDSNSDGDFINQAALDSNLDILYTNGSSSFSYQLYRYSNLLNIPENGSATKEAITDPLLDSSPTAITVSSYTTKSSSLLIGTETGKLLKVTNGNATPVWTDISGSSFLGSISDVEFGESEKEIYVTFHNYNVSSIWYSNDGGETWSEKEGDFPDIPVKAILANPIVSNEVIIGTELGVWKTSNWHDSNPNWIQSYNGMSDVKVTDFHFRKNDHTVMAATYGRGLFSGVFGSSTPTFVISQEESTMKLTEAKEISFSVDIEVFGEFEESVDATVTGNPIGSVVSFDSEFPVLINENRSFSFTITPTTEYEEKSFELVLEVSSQTQTKKLSYFMEVDDGIDANVDNCVEIANPDQLDSDGDGIGNICDDDSDNDGVLDMDDNCQLVFNPEQLDIDEDDIGDICDNDIAINLVNPKGFSPNNDGVNDTWEIDKLIELYPGNELEIYNRSGQLVYKASPYKNDFSGISNVLGNTIKLPVGSYMYILKSGDPIANFYPSSYVKKGWIYIKY